MSKKSIRQGAGAAIIDAEGLCLILERNPKHWTGWGLVKGGLDEGEDELCGMRREVREEIGYEITELDCIVDLEIETSYVNPTHNCISYMHWFGVVLHQSGRDMSLVLERDEWLSYRWEARHIACQKLRWDSERAVLEAACQAPQPI